jgi:PAS domain S-box-containing protein
MEPHDAPRLDKLSRLRAALRGIRPGSRVVRRLRRALHDDELVVHYQPQVDLASGRAVGAEALVRWADPERGLILPGEFLPSLERDSLMPAVTRRVVDIALAQCGVWKRAGHELTVSVNVPAESLFDPGFPADVARLLGESEIPPALLVLEITENVIMDDPPRALERLEQLRRLGVQLALDDFGTGYSSLARLSRLPIDELKIDRSFVSGMGQNEGDLMAVRLIADLGSYLGKRIVVEGVETERDVGTLRVLGCDIAQGYHYSSALSEQRFLRWLEERRDTLPPAEESLAFARAATPALDAPPAPAALSRAELEELVDGAHDAFVSIDENGVIIAWNRRAEEAFGWRSEEALGRRLITTIIPPRLWDAFEGGLKGFLETGEDRTVGKPRELPAVDRLGREFPVEVRLSLLRTTDGIRVNAFLHDISARKLAERRAEAQHAVARILAASATLEEATGEVLATIGSELGWDLVQLWLAGDDGLRPRDAWHQPELAGADFLQQSHEIALADQRGLPHRVLEGGRGAWIDDVLKDEGFPRFQGAARAGLRTAAAVPLETSGETLGVIELFSRTISRRDEELMKTLTTLGETLAQFLRRCQAESDAEQEHQQLVTVGAIVRELLSSEGPEEARRGVCAAAAKVSGASSVVLLEPSTGEELVSTAAEGADIDGLRVSRNGEPSGAVVAFDSGQPYFAADAPHDPTLGQRLVAETRAASVLFQPVLGDGESVGVLVAVWEAPLPAVPRSIGRGLGLLAGEVAVAIERADLLTRLELVSRTDQLTGLPNRPASIEEMRRAVAAAAATQRPLTVAIVELASAAGQELGAGPGLSSLSLKELTAAWRSTLRRNDYLARIDRTRLTLIMPDTSVPEARPVIERMQAARSVPGSRTQLIEWDGVETAEALELRLGQAAAVSAHRSDSPALDDIGVQGGA